MDFAKSILEKYGWKEGQGLGKNDNGIAQPVKANLKFDQAGLGHDKAEDITNNWWERVYNKAANNLDIGKDQDQEVTVNLKQGKSIEITTKLRPSNLVASKDASYGGTFLKTATLTNAGIEMTHEKRITEPPPEMPIIPAMSDEALFKACNGRTAHKGARHGLNLSGKLSRLEAQENELMNKLATPTQAFVDWIQVKQKSEKNSKQIPIVAATTTTTAEAKTADELKKPTLNLNENDYVYQSKKDRKRRRILDESLAAVFEATFASADIGKRIKSTTTTKTDTSTVIDGKIKKKKKSKQKYGKTTEDAIAAELLNSAFAENLKLSSNRYDEKRKKEKQEKRNKKQEAAMAASAAAIADDDDKMNPNEYSKITFDIGDDNETTTTTTKQSKGDKGKRNECCSCTCKQKKKKHSHKHMNTEYTDKLHVKRIGKKEKKQKDRKMKKSKSLKFKIMLTDVGRCVK